MWLFTDPERTPDPNAIAAMLPAGSGVIYRSFGRAGALDEAARLATIARNRGLIFLVGQDVALAEVVGAHGVHLPQRLLTFATAIRRRHPSWLITGAAHDLLAVRRGEIAGCDGIFVSPAFPSRSASAGRPLGVFRVAALARRASCPIFALGGVNAWTARRLAGAHGFAAVEAFAGSTSRTEAQNLNAVSRWTRGDAS